MTRRTLNRRALVFGTVPLAVASSSAVGFGRPVAADGFSSSNGLRTNRSLFARNVAGTWFSGDLPGYQQLQHIYADGTTIWSNNFEYGYGTSAFLNGAVYGTWEQTGRREMRSVEIGFIYDGVGTHTETGRVSVAYTFARDFSTYDADFIEELFQPSQDPTNPDEVPIFSFGGTFTGKRVTLLSWSNPNTGGTRSAAEQEAARELRPFAVPVAP